jgi:teichuronic acid biosynthesis glycosyltransferase TuaC
LEQISSNLCPSAISKRLDRLRPRKSANTPSVGTPLGRPIRIGTFTTLFPNARQPTHGVFVENRLRHLVATGRVTSRVMAPVPWFPRMLRALAPSYAKFIDVPRVENRYGIAVSHPRYPVLPRLGMSLAPALLLARCLPALRRLQTEGGDFDLIDAHYFYPEGVAAILLGKALSKPVVITARGTDVNLIPGYRLPRWMIQYAAREAAGIVAVSHALKRELVALGVPGDRIRVLRNGVDLDMFCPRERSMARARLSARGPTLLSVGHLIDRKGHDLVIGALPSLPGYCLIVAGDGPERSALERLAARLEVADRVRFLGSIPHERLADVYAAADALILASSREGWPNVLLEAMACGTPVVASNIWGNPEVVTAPEAGVLMSERTENGIAAAVRLLFERLPDRAATRRYAEQFSWDATTEGQIELFSKILRMAAGPGSERSGEEGK